MFKIERTSDITHPIHIRMQNDLACAHTFVLTDNEALRMLRDLRTVVADKSAVVDEQRIRSIVRDEIDTEFGNHARISRMIRTELQHMCHARSRDFAQGVNPHA